MLEKLLHNGVIGSKDDEYWCQKLLKKHVVNHLNKYLINAGHDGVQAQMLGKYQLDDSGNDRLGRI